MERWGKWLAAAAALALCLGAVIFGSLQFARGDVAAAPAEPREALSEVERFRQARERLRAVEKAQLNDVAHNPDTDPELAEMARGQLVELCAREEQELTIEGILALRGWDEPVATVHKDSVNILLKADAAKGDIITQSESAIIMELVCRETGVQRGNVKIIPLE